MKIESWEQGKLLICDGDGEEEGEEEGEERR